MHNSNLLMHCPETKLMDIDCFLLGWGWFLVETVYVFYKYFKATIMVVIYDVIYVIKLVLGLY